MAHHEGNSSRALAERFTTTHWGLVAKAATESGPAARAALAVLCQMYWYPLYAFIRRNGYNVADAHDLTQGFFAMLLDGETFRRADPARGKFRSYLLGALQHFLSDARDRERAAKRGSGRLVISIDSDVEGRISANRSPDEIPERWYDRQWALTVLGHAMTELRQEYERTGKSPVFEALQPLMTGDRSAEGYVGIADRLGMSEGAVKVAMHRLRARYGDLIRLQIAKTVSTTEEIDDEIRYLFEALGK